MSKPKMTTGSFFGGLFKRGIRNVKLDESAPQELHDLLSAVQDELAKDDIEETNEPEKVVIDVVGETND